ncbi:MAG: histidine triad nucleotide-binding protein [Anaerolineales bacterium]|nr:histidine triad nucleotide-binding protein [Anaerolineales bacterium]
MSSCIFCNIIQGKAPAEIVYQDELVTAFHDNHPVAPVHLLIVPNKHIPSLNEWEASDEPTAGRLLSVAKCLAEQFHLRQSGYRLITNTGADSGQAVFHLHVHLIGGRRMRFLG